MMYKHIFVAIDDSDTLQDLSTFEDEVIQAAKKILIDAEKLAHQSKNQ